MYHLYYRCSIYTDEYNIYNTSDAKLTIKKASNQSSVLFNS